VIYLGLFIGEKPIFTKKKSVALPSAVCQKLTYLITYVALQPIPGKGLLKKISQCLLVLSTVRPISDS
jgi:hypothetical protein